MEAYLGLQKRKQTTSDQGFSIERGSKMMGRIATGRHISDGDKSAKGIIIK